VWVIIKLSNSTRPCPCVLFEGDCHFRDSSLKTHPTPEAANSVGFDTSACRPAVFLYLALRHVKTKTTVLLQDSSRLHGRRLNHFPDDSVAGCPGWSSQL